MFFKEAEYFTGTPSRFVQTIIQAITKKEGLDIVIMVSIITGGLEQIVL